MNPWEAHFQRYVQGRSLGCEKIPESDKQTPDFRINAGSLPHQIIAEVKTLSPNDLDKRLRKGAEEFDKHAREGETVAGVVDTYWVTTHLSIRKHLRDARKQFKAYSPAGASNVVVIYSERESDFRRLGSDTVQQALFGDMQSHYQVTEGGAAIPAGTSRTNQLFQPSLNTTISAVACLREPGSNKFFVFHNPYAKNRLPLFLFADGECVQYWPERVKGQGTALLPYTIRL